MKDKKFEWKKPVVKPDKTTEGAFHRRAANFTKVKPAKEKFTAETWTHIEERKKLK